MAYQTIYKHLVFKDETTWGVSANSSLRYIPVTSSSIEENINKALVEDTSTSMKGRDRMYRGKSEITGEVSSFASPKVLHTFLELVNGVHGATAASGTSALIVTYNQNTDGNYISQSVIHDRNNSQEAFYGIRGTKLSLQASDGLVECSLSTIGKTRGNGVAVVDTIGETVVPFMFSDITVTIGRPSYASPVTLNVSDWNIDYDNKMEPGYLSSSRNPLRTDPSVPELTGSFTIYHEGTSWVSATYGASDFYLRIEAASDSSTGLIAGVTPYYLRIDVPRVQLTKTSRNYEQAALSVEKIEFTAYFDPGLSMMWKPQLTTGFDIEA